MVHGAAASSLIGFGSEFPGRCDGAALKFIDVGEVARRVFREGEFEAVVLRGARVRVEVLVAGGVRVEARGVDEGCSPVCCVKVVIAGSRWCGVVCGVDGDFDGVPQVVVGVINTDAIGGYCSLEGDVPSDGVCFCS